MDILIYRTEQADRRSLYNGLEFSAARHGARILGYVDSRGPGRYKGRPVYTPPQLAELGVDAVIAPAALTAEDRQLFRDAGWPGSRLLSYETHPGACVERFQCEPTWLPCDRRAVVGGVVTSETTHYRLGDVSIADVPSPLAPDAQRALVERVFDALALAKHDEPTTGPYVVGANWGGFLKATRPNFYRALQECNTEALTTLLASLFRNEMTTGMFAGGAAYETYRNFTAAGRATAQDIRRHFNIWRYSVSSPDLSRLAESLVGNPFGVFVDDRMIHANTFANDYRAQHVLGLVDGVERPIVVDLGGGFGGFGRQLFMNCADMVYVGFDLPENLLVASYFLMASHPEKRVLLYESPDQVLDTETLRQYDLVMMPHFMLPQLADRAADVFTNLISLSEMDYGSIGEYMKQVDRTCGGFFYQENMLDNHCNFHYYPAPVFPELGNFKQISSTPSRWPSFSPASPAHCHGEFLAVRRDLDLVRYLGKRPDVGQPQSAVA